MNTKDLIIETAFASFLEEGFDNVSLNKLINRTGLSKGAFYHNFKSKEELLNEIVDRYLLGYITRYMDETNTTEKTMHFEATINQFIGNLCDFGSNAPKVLGESIDIKAFFHLLFSLMKQNDMLKKSYLDMKFRMIVIFRKMMETAMKNRDIRDDINAENVAVTLYTVFRGTMLEWVISDDDSIEPLLRNNMNTILSMMKVQ